MKPAPKPSAAKTKKSNMPNAATGAPSTSDGGRVALSGFLYQILGALGLRASGTAESQGSKAYALFSLVKDDTVVVHEPYDSDVGLLLPLAEGAKHGVVLAQFKYSVSGSLSTIPPSEFKNILDSFHAAASAVATDSKVLAGRFLVTNREYSPETKKIVDAIAVKGSHADLSSDQTIVAASLQFVSGIQPEVWTSKLNDFGKQYGLTGIEIQNGIERLLGHVLAHTASRSHCVITRASLIESLTGSSHANSLTHDTVLPIMERGLNELGTPPSHALIDRPDAERLYSQYNDRALVVCTGPGGSGKTAAVRKWAHATVKTRFVGTKRLSRVTSNLIVHLIDDWRGGIASNDNPQSAIQRLSSANPAISAPLLFLNIDGIDERSHVGEQTDSICAVLDWFWQQDEAVRQGHKGQPDAKLFVTCRCIDDFKKFWHPNTGGGGSTLPEMPPVIQFGFFTDDEFEALLHSERSTLADEVYNSLIQTVHSATTETIAGNRGLGPFSPVPRVAYSPDTNSAFLRHPALWEAFMCLPQDQQAPFLNGDNTACLSLAKQYFERFLEKAVERSDGVSKHVIKTSFSMLASASKAQHSANPHFSLWNKTIGVDLGLGCFVAIQLFEEACSAGIIERDSDKWRWRYPFVEQYLAGIHAGGAK